MTSFREFRVVSQGRWTLATIALIYAVTRSALADDAATQVGASTLSAADIVDAMISNRERLHAGTCRAKWLWQTTQYKETATWSLYFDYDKGWSRIDRQIINKAREVIRIVTPVEVIDYVPGPSGTITRLSPGAPALAEGYVFDVRITGLAPLLQIKRNEATWDGYLSIADRDRKASSEKQGNGTFKLTWERIGRADAPGQKVFERVGHSLWIDPRKQFSPVRAEFFAGASPDESGGERKVFAIVETEWAQRDGVLVPQRCAWTEPLHRQTAELSFEWISVNHSVPPALFTPEGLNPPKGTQIINSKLGESFIESIVGEEPPQKQSSVPRKNTRTLAIIGGATVCALVAAGRLWKRRGISGVDSAGFSSGR